MHLYIDYNGGLRYIASMLLSTANLMEQRGATIENILTINFENPEKDGFALVENYMGILQASRLVSGISEYVDYGRNGELLRYFKDCKDPLVQKIIKEMGILTYHLQMCDTDEIFGGDNILALKRDLNNYINEHENDLTTGKGDYFSVLFCYVANDILIGYEPLFGGDLLDIIDWCRDRDFLQQAVTFYAERMPIYFWENEIYYPSEKEKAEYEKIQIAIRSFKEEKKKPQYKQSSQRQKTAILANKLAEIGSIPQNTNFKTKKTYVDTINKEYQKYNWQVAWMGKYLEQGYTDSYDWIPKELPEGINSPEDMKVTWNVEEGFTIEGHGRTCSICTDPEELWKILRDYGKIKGQRNLSAHANGKDGRWNYENLKDRLESFVEDIRKLMEKYKPQEC